MNIWTISIKTDCQSNTYCVDDESKIDPYIKECMKKVKSHNKYTNNRYEIKWLAVDFAVIYEINENGNTIFENNQLLRFGEVHRYSVH